MGKKPPRRHKATSTSTPTSNDGTRPVAGDARPSSFSPISPEARLSAGGLTPGLYIVSTPIGNLRDITLRALDILASCDLILCEDTRQTRKLLDAYGIQKPMKPCHDHNEAALRPYVIDILQKGQRVALVSDAGTPLISDPGFKLVRDCRAQGLAVIPVPGASALLAGLVAAGLPTDRFAFIGFLPPKAAARRDALAELAAQAMTLVFYEAPQRLSATLSDMAKVLGASRQAAVAREITKKFEETRADSLEALARHYAQAPTPKGEIVIVVAGACKDRDALQAADSIDRLLAEAMGAGGMSLRDAAALVADKTGLARKQVYSRALALASARGATAGKKPPKSR